jgi:tetratricopeptide (TPR) repeat protein
MIQNSEGTQPNKPIAPKRRGRMFLFSLLIILVILAIVLLVGYQQGIAIRRQNQVTVVTQQLTEQFQFATEDIQAGRYEIAKQRLEFILTNDPAFPGVQEKLTQVLVLMNVHTPTVTPSLTPTPDFSGAEQAYAKAGQLIAAQDWPGALGALDEMRKLDPSYQQSQVDGMYYFALRNYGYDLITQKGNLEGGIYQLTLAERFGPLDRDANGIREGARVYIIGASFWELNWQQALFYFDQARNWGNLWDGTMTSSERYWFASMRYADQLFAQGKMCEEDEALVYYQNAQSVAPLDKTAQNNFNQADLACHPPTDTPAPFTETPTPGAPLVTDTPIPTDIPTETPTTAPTP